jgi:hypothetical protein
MSEAAAGALANDLEQALVVIYEREPEMFDGDALAAVDILSEELRTRTPPPDLEQLSLWAFAAYEALRETVAEHLGLELPYEKSMAEPPPRGDLLDIATAVDVLDQLRHAIVTWQTQGGLRGYYTAVRPQ